MQEANRLGLQVTDEGLRQFLHSGMYGQVLFPKGVYIGDDKYRELISQQFNISTQKFETEVKKEIEENRLKAMVTGGITVSDSEVRSYYVDQGTKIKFDYAVINSADLEKADQPDRRRSADVFQDQRRQICERDSGVPQDQLFRLQRWPGTGRHAAGQRCRNPAVLHPASEATIKVDEQVKVRHILIKVGSGRRSQGRRGGQGQGRRHSETDQGGRKLRRTGEGELRRSRQQGPGRRARLPEARRDRSRVRPGRIYAASRADIGPDQDEVRLSHPAGGREADRAYASAG